MFSSFLVTFLFVGCLYAQNYANTDRFKKENSALVSLGRDEKRVVFMGNSITEGWLHARPQFFAHKSYVNRGIGGELTSQMLLRFRQDVIELEPAVVVIFGGTNDIAWDSTGTEVALIAGNIMSMAELAIANGIDVVLCSVLPCRGFSPQPRLGFAEEVTQLNQQLKDYADRAGIVYIDYFSAMVDENNGLKRHLGYDTVHPNKVGYSVMEPILEKGIRRAMEKK